MNPTLEQIKTDESVWPENASHYKQGIFYRKDTGVWVDSIDNEPSLNNNGWFIDATVRPTKAFVPEVGEHLEVSWGKKVEWHECVILPDNKIALLSWIQAIREVSELFDIEFRPIKSERDLTVEAAMKVLDKNPTAIPNELLGMLYDSGLLTINKESGK